MNVRQILFWFHLICGCTVGIVILSMAVTGTILAFEPQILNYAERGEKVVVVPADAQKLKLDDLVSKVSASKPDGKITAISVFADPASSMTVNLGREDMVYVNPYTGEILGKESKVSKFMHSVEEWHRWFGKKEFGKPITGFSVVVFFFIVVSGIYLWWPKSFSFPGIKNIIFFNPRVQGRARDWNWHNTIGFWCCLILLITTITGTIMAHQWATNLLYRATGNEPPPVQNKDGYRGEKRKVAGELKDELPIASFESFYAAAQKQMPNWYSINIRLPQKADGPVTVNILESEPSHIKPRSQLTLDAQTATITKWEPFAEQNMGKKLRSWVKPLHTGQIAGIFGQTVMLVGALGAIMLVWTGFALAAARFAGFRERAKLKRN